jgi:hypothetical protein
VQIADSRFQEELIRRAIAEGKLPQSFQLGSDYRRNTPQNLALRFQPLSQNFPPFPFGTDFSNEEVFLGKALQKLKKMGKAQLLWTIGRALVTPIRETNRPYLLRMSLERPQTIAEKFYQRLLNAVL